MSIINLRDEIDKRRRAKVLRQAIKAIKRIRARELAQKLAEKAMTTNEDN